jgi:hypothetical protein
MSSKEVQRLPKWTALQMDKARSGAEQSNEAWVLRDTVVGDTFTFRVTLQCPDLGLE